MNWPDLPGRNATEAEWDVYFEKTRAIEEERRTRIVDRHAADPEAFEREKARRRREREAMGQRGRETRDFDNANADLKPVSPYPRGWSRLHEIWAAIVQAEQAAKLESIYLDQASRIANVKNRERMEGQRRGLGRAARAAGF